MSREPRVLHMFDCAGVAATLVKEARARGLRWRYFPRLRERFATPFKGDFLVWAVWRTVATVRAQVLHVHFGDRARWARKWPHRPFVMHLHGTDIRELYDMPQHRAAVQEGLDHAVAVLYATPDLGDHALKARPDAVYVPNPIAVDALPPWRPHARRRVVFASRWDESKGLEDQLTIARMLRETLPQDVELLGLDWGSGAAQAREAGVELVAPMPSAEYEQWLASAHVVVGQSAGVLAISELQAIGIGVPVVMPPPHRAYEEPPVIAVPPQEVAEAVSEVLADPQAASARLDGPAWVRQHHDPETAIAQLRAIYDEVLAGRQ